MLGVMRFSSALASHGDFRRQRIMLVCVSGADGGVLEALGAERERHATNGIDVRGNGSESVVIGECESVGSGCQQRPREQLVRCRRADLPSKPPATVLLIFRVLYAAEGAQR